MLAPLVVVGFLAVVLATGAVLLALSSSRLKVQLDEARSAWLALRETPRQLEAALRDATDAQHLVTTTRQEVASLREQLATTQARLSQALVENKQKEDWLDHQEKEVAWYKQELTKRPKILRRTYKILTLGVSGTGKTALTLKWANPLVDLGTLRGTKVERYERTVSHMQDGDEMFEHVFEIRDWGGEHIVDALQELIVDEIHGLLFVVDLTTKDGTAVEPERIQQQLREFRAESLKFFFGPKTLAACQSVVLFINKSDVLAGTPADVEREARAHYQPLIDDLLRFKSVLDVSIFVGSATYGHSTHHLFAHFVSRILPESAYDHQLLQRMKADGATESSLQPFPAGSSPITVSVSSALPAHPEFPPPPPLASGPDLAAAPPPAPASPPRRAIPPTPVPGQRPAPVAPPPLPPPPPPVPSPADAPPAILTRTARMPDVDRR